MKNDFQSFAEAFAEASKKQNKEYAEFDNKKAMLDQVRRQFRSFLDALSIEYTSFKQGYSITKDYWKYGIISATHFR